MEATVMESCHSTWIFDPERMRFRRILKDVRVGSRCVTTQWRPYFQLRTEPGEAVFTVVLTPDGSRLVRSWRHTHGCRQCGGQVTCEHSLDEIRQAVNS
jgi:hypothetical protein